MENGDIAERVKGRIAGAIKQTDSDDVLADEYVDEVSETLATAFERDVRSRMSVQVQESLAGDADE